MENLIIKIITIDIVVVNDNYLFYYSIYFSIFLKLNINVILFVNNPCHMMIHRLPHIMVN